MRRWKALAYIALMWNSVWIALHIPENEPIIWLAIVEIILCLGLVVLSIKLLWELAGGKS